jgi:hypothetical protein
LNGRGGQRWDQKKKSKASKSELAVKTVARHLKKAAAEKAAVEALKVAEANQAAIMKPEEKVSAGGTENASLNISPETGTPTREEPRNE